MFIIIKPKPNYANSIVAHLKTHNCTIDVQEKLIAMRVIKIKWEHKKYTIHESDSIKVEIPEFQIEVLAVGAD